MDVFGWYVVTLHQLLGHDKSAAFTGLPAGSRAECLVCAFEREPTDERRQAVIEALGQ